MKPLPDKIFHEKLADHRIAPPVEAWQKVEANTQGRKKNVIWYKVAASIVVAIAGTFWWISRPDVVAPVANTSAVSTPGDSASQEAKKEQMNTRITQSIARDTAISREEQEPKTSLRIEEQLEEHPSPMITSSETVAQENELDSLLSSEVSTEVNMNITVSSPQPAFRAPTGSTIVISYEESTEYLTKNTEAQATTEEKKSSTFRKLLKKAADLKTNQDPFGELRQKKNEILALNFGSEKRGQKK